jgi:hypothetical protein
LFSNAQDDLRPVRAFAFRIDDVLRLDDVVRISAVFACPRKRGEVRAAQPCPRAIARIDDVSIIDDISFSLPRSNERPGLLHRPRSRAMTRRGEVFRRIIT